MKEVINNSSIDTPNLDVLTDVYIRANILLDYWRKESENSTGELDDLVISSKIRVLEHVLDITN